MEKSIIVNKVSENFGKVKAAHFCEINAFILDELAKEHIDEIGRRISSGLPIPENVLPQLEQERDWYKDRCKELSSELRVASGEEILKQSGI
jgi:hypothetical protein